LCFFFRMRLRRFLMSDPMAAVHLTRSCRPVRRREAIFLPPGAELWDAGRAGGG
jgi:hypothetical protein